MTKTVSRRGGDEITTNKIIIGLLAVLVLIVGTIAFKIQQTKSREEAVRKHDRMMDQQLCKAVFADKNGHWQEKQECIAKGIQEGRK